MAVKQKTSTVSSFHKKPKVRRKGVHAKTKSSTNKGAALYKKPSASQG